MNVSDNTLDLSSEEEKAEMKKSNEDNKAMFDIMKECIGNDIFGIQFTTSDNNRHAQFVVETMFDYGNQTFLQGRIRLLCKRPDTMNRLLSCSSSRLR